MAKVLVEFDTVSKAFTVSMDGKQFENVNGVSLYKRSPYYDSDSDADGDLGYVDIMQREENDSDGYVTYTRISASQHVDAKAAAEKGEKITEIAELPGFVTVTAGASPADTLVEKDIVNFFQTKR
jgi:hypothetical protein